VPPTEQGIYTPTIIARNQIKPNNTKNEAKQPVTEIKQKGVQF